MVIAAIIHDGVLRCIGTPIELKRNYGCGMVLNVIFDSVKMKSEGTTCQEQLKLLTDLLAKWKTQGVINGFQYMLEKAGVQTAKFGVRTGDIDRN